MKKNKSPILVSACLAGVECRYDCQSKMRQEIRDLVEKGEAIPVCPEELGGLPTPRDPAEKVQEKFLTKAGSDVTNEYMLGASMAMAISNLANCHEARLKSKSPMCGKNQIYDGTFSGNLKSGEGVFTELLIKNKIKVISID